MLKNWKFVLAAPVLIALVRIVLVLFLARSRSSKRIMKKFNGDFEKAKERLRVSLSYVYSEDGVNSQLHEIKHDWEGEHETSSKALIKASFKELFGKKYRFRFFVGLFIGSGQQMSGIALFTIYSTVFFNRIDADGSLLTIVMGAVNLIGAFCNTYLINKLDRKANMLIGKNMSQKVALYKVSDSC